MKTIINLFFVSFFAVLGLMLKCYQKEEPEECEVSFSMNISDILDYFGLKCTPEYDLSEAAYIVITIKKSDGTSTGYKSSHIDVLKLNGGYYSQKIFLKPGSYRLTEFLIADSEDNIIFAVPKT